jgi:hypothetical protein
MTTDGLPHQVRASAEAREAALRSEVAVLRARDATAENEVERCRRELYVEMEAKRLAYDLSPMPRLCEVNAQMTVALAAEQELKTALWATLLAVSAAVDPVLEATTSLPEPDGMLVMAPALPRPSSPAALPSAALGTAPTTAPTTALTTALTTAPSALPSGTKTMLQSCSQPPPPPPPWTDTGLGSAARAATAAVAAAEAAIASASALARLSSAERGGAGGAAGGAGDAAGGAGGAAGDAAGGAGGAAGGAGGAGGAHTQQQAAQVEQWVHAQQTAHAQQAAASAHQAAHAQHILASVGRVCTVCTSALDRLQLALANEAAVREEASRHRGKLEEMRRELGARALRIPADDH